MAIRLELTGYEKKIVVFLLSLLLIGATVSLVRGKVPWNNPSEHAKD